MEAPVATRRREGHHEPVSTATALTWERGSGDWLDDLREHRRMFAQSRFQWAPEDPVLVLLAYTRGRLVFETKEDLLRLNLQQQRLRAYTSQISSAMALPVQALREIYPAGQWREALTAAGLGAQEASSLAAAASSHEAPANADVRRALRGIPLPNPLSQVWELRQMRSMYQAADDLAEDALCDLVEELEHRYGLGKLADLTGDRSAAKLWHRLEHQRSHRGLPGDPRRRPQQRF